MKDLDWNQIGKAYKAFEAFNFKIKLGRLTNFDPARWIKVVNAIEGKKSTKLVNKIGYSIERKPTPSKRWTPERRKRFKATIEARRQANGHA